MPADTTAAPEFRIVDATSEPSDAAVSALARLLLSVADADDATTTNKKTAVSAT